jgi:seryl-tRNA synthetase
MSENKLRDDIEKLRDEIKTLNADEDTSKEKLENLLQDIESGLETEAQDKKQSELLAGLKESVEHFEAEHPRATAIINDIMVTLSNMGI